MEFFFPSFLVSFVDAHLTARRHSSPSLLLSPFGPLKDPEPGAGTERERSWLSRESGHREAHRGLGDGKCRSFPCWLRGVL